MVFGYVWQIFGFKYFIYAFSSDLKAIVKEVVVWTFILDKSVIGVEEHFALSHAIPVSVDHKLNGLLPQG